MLKKKKKNIKKKDLAKKPELKAPKTEKSKDPSQVKELVLPNLNLKQRQFLVYLKMLSMI